MEIKKTEKADLENKKSLFLQIGLVLALSLTLVGFEYKSYEKDALVLQGANQGQDVIEEVVMNTQQETPPPPPEQAPQTTLLNIVENTVDVNNDIEIDAESDDKTINQEYVAPQGDNEQEKEELEIFTVVEESPDYMGGDLGRIKFLQDNIKYPQMARESGIQGTVYVTFVVERDGSVTDVKVQRGIGGGCDEEAIRVVKSMPKWKPGKQRGKSVRVQFNMPIKFTLQG